MTLRLFIVVFIFSISGCGGESDTSDTSTSNPVPANQENSPNHCLPNLTVYNDNSTRPTITLNGNKVERLLIGENYSDQGVIATDKNGINISANVTVSGLTHIDTSVAADYIIKYDVSDNDNITALPVYRFVRVIGQEPIDDSKRSFDDIDAPWEYIEHLPAWFGENLAVKYPLIIVNHGWSHSKRFADNTNPLAAMSTQSMVSYLRSQQADPDLPFIIITPQRCWSDFGPRQIEILHTFVEWAKRHYPVDESRIYMTGLSMGGWATWEYVRVHPNNMAAASPMAAGGNQGDICRASPTPIWAFAARNDATVSYTDVRDTIQALQACAVEFRAYPKFTLFSTGGHVIDDDVINMNFLGLGESPYDIYDQSLFDWFLLHQLPEE